MQLEFSDFSARLVFAAQPFAGALRVGGHPRGGRRNRATLGRVTRSGYHWWRQEDAAVFHARRSLTRALRSSRGFASTHTGSSPQNPGQVHLLEIVSMIHLDGTAGEPWAVDLPTATSTVAWGRILGEVAQEAICISLHGDLGAGKTTFAQGVGDGLAVHSEVVSPTFSLVDEHDGPVPLSISSFSTPACPIEPC